MMTLKNERTKKKEGQQLSEYKIITAVSICAFPDYVSILYSQFFMYLISQSSASNALSAHQHID